jgi:hypothetical protein
MKVIPHVAAKTGSSAIDDSTTRHVGYQASQIVRKRIEEAFGWVKAAAGFARASTGVWPASAGSAPSPWPPTISSGCRNSCLRRPHE